MARYTGPKHRLARREGVNILEKDSPSLLKRLNVRPGVHGHKRTRKLSEYGLQLREKQKVKRIYGVLERQFRRYVREAQRKKGDSSESLLRLLETRLDNIVYRLGFSPSRPMARQLVSHGHVRIDGTRVNIPSYQVKVGEAIGLGDKAMKIPTVGKLLEEKEVHVPPFLERKGPQGRLVRVPDTSEVPLNVDAKLIMEYYSR